MERNEHRQKIQINENNYYRATFYGLVLLTYYLIVHSIFHIKLIDYIIPLTNSNEVGINMLGVTYILSNLIRFVTCIWIISKVPKLNRSKLLWGFWAFFTPAIALIVFGFKDYYIPDARTREKIQKLKLNYKRELLDVKAKCTRENELSGREEELNQKYNSRIRKEMERFNKLQETVEKAENKKIGVHKEFQNL